MTPDALRLYHSPASPNSRRVRILVAEKGLKVPLVAVDLGKGEQHIKWAGCSRCITIDSNPGALRSPGLELEATDPLHFNRCCVRDSR